MKLPQMSNVVRWKYVLPRAVVVAALGLAVRFGLDPMLHWGLVASGEAILGAKVEIGGVTTSLRDGEIVITKISAANPQKPMRNLLEADDLHLVVDPRQLLRNRVVVHEGIIRGVQFDSPRSDSGALEAMPVDEAAGPSVLDPLIAAAGDSAAAWLGSLEGRVQDDLEAKLATPRVLKDLEARWPQQYEALKTRAEALGAQAKQIDTSVREAKKNPLRSAGALAGLQQQLTTIQAELKSTMAEITALPSQAQADRAAIEAARKQDEELLKNVLQVAKVDGDQLTQYLLGDEAGGYLRQTVSWIETVRHYLPKKKLAAPMRARGVDVLFGKGRQPRMLIESVNLTATANMNGQTIALVGELTDAASEPQWHNQPLRLRLTSTGAVAATLAVELDRRGDKPHDSLVLDCPHLAMPARALGKADRMAVNMTAGDASVHADVKLVGDALAGVIELRQAGTLEAATGAIRDDRIAQVLDESLAGVDHVEAKVQLAGTLKKPQWKIESNLGPQLAAGVDGAMRKYLTDRKDRLMAKITGGVDEQLAKLDGRRQEAQQELLGKLGDDQKLIGELASLAGGNPLLESLGVPELSKKLDLDKLRK